MAAKLLKIWIKFIKIIAIVRITMYLIGCGVCKGEMSTPIKK